MQRARVDEKNVQALVDQLSTDRRYLIDRVVRNNPAAVRQALDIDQRMPLDQLSALVVALDPEEQEAALAVPYRAGREPELDAASDAMRESLREIGIDAPETTGQGTMKVAGAVIAGLVGLTQLFIGQRTAREQAEAEARAELARLEAERLAREEAERKEKARQEGRKKARPWIIGMIILILLALYKLVQQ